MAEQLVLQRPLVSFDLETTGLNIQHDRIVEISCVKTHVNGHREVLTRRLNPQMPIAKDATAIHGISDADVANAPAFADVAGELAAFLRHCDVSGFNIEHFDLPMLTRQFVETGIVFPEGPMHVIDTMRIFCRREPRDLSAAYRFYCNGTLEQAHSAEADAVAAADILLGQLTRYEDLPRTPDALHAFCHPSHPDWIDPDGKVVWREDEPVLSFGRHRHRSLRALAEQEPDYLRWITSANFSDAVVRIAREALDGTFPRRHGEL